MVLSPEEEQMRVVLCSATDVATRLGVSRETVRLWVRNNGSFTYGHNPPPKPIIRGTRRYWTSNQLESEWMSWHENHRTKLAEWLEEQSLIMKAQYAQLIGKNR